VATDYVDMTDPQNLARAIRPETRAIYFETPVNPTLDLIDISAVVRIAKQVNGQRPPGERISVVVDNTFATPFCQRPLELGVDLVVHSLTKGLGGFGTDMGGVVIGSRRHESDLLLFRKDFGAALSSRSAWPLLVYGLPTLELRMQRQEQNAARVAEFLAGRPEVERVAYPGREDFPQRDLFLRQMRDFDGNPAAGNLIYFVLKGSVEEAYQRGRALVDDVARNAYTLTLAVSLGQIRTLIEMPASMTHAVVPEEAKAGGGIDPGGIRLSIGIESPDDVIRDLEACFARIG
jgi:cystathionine beta-lyase/cystathionine gamma-synthase